MKRLFDFAAALVGIVLLFPLLVLLGVLVMATSKGPALYRGRRIGCFGKPFFLIKFRSMLLDAERQGGPTTAGDDPRLTRIGAFMRRFKLDELPQLFNVMAGDMSIVGPRPEVLSELAEYTGKYAPILTLRPGITDWASLWNADEGAILEGAKDPHAAYKKYIQPTKLELQLKYWRERSFWLDLKLIFYTLYKIVRKGWVPAELRQYPLPVLAPEDKVQSS